MLLEELNPSPKPLSQHFIHPMCALLNIRMMLRQYYVKFWLNFIPFFRGRRQHLFKMVNVPKARNTYCAKCNKHGKFKVIIIFSATGASYYCSMMIDDAPR